MSPPPANAADTEAPTPVSKKRKTKEKKQIIDSVTELSQGGRGAGGPINQDTSSILTEPHFLPRSTVVMRLLEIRNDPISHFLPTKVTSDGTFFCAGPPGLAPELAELFMRPINGATKRRGKSPGRSSKKPRLDDDADEMEEGRRAGSLAPSLGVGSDIINPGDGGIDLNDHSMTFDDYLPVDDFQHDTAGVRDKSAPPSELSRLSTPAPDTFFDEMEESYADASCPIAMFDSRPAIQTQSTQEADRDVEREVESSNAEGKGYSKNTVKALGIIRKELRPLDGSDNEEKVMSFSKMADKVRH
jgi:cohesin complex subunit SCC1